MSCWHVSMGKGYSLLAPGSAGAGPGAPACCTAASWTSTTRLLSRGSETDADAEAREMVSEFRAMVLIGDRWANSPHPEDPDHALDEPHEEDFDAMTRGAADGGGTTGSGNSAREKVASVKSDARNLHSTVVSNAITRGAAYDGDTTGSGCSAPQNVENVDDNASKLYSTVVKSTRRAVEPSPSPPSILNSDPVLEGTLFDEILSFSVCEEAAPPGGASPSRHSPVDRCLLGIVCGGREISDHEEESKEELSQEPPPLGAGEGPSQLITLDVEVHVAGREDDSDNEVDGLDKTLTGDDNSYDPEGPSQQRPLGDIDG